MKTNYKKILNKKMKVLIFSFLLISTLVFTTNLTMARGLSSKVTGEIRAESSSGPLIEGAKVKLLVQGLIEDIEYSDADGKYTVVYYGLIVAPIHCVLQIEKEGYITDRISSTLPATPGTTVENIILEDDTPPPPPPPQNTHISGHLWRTEDNSLFVAVEMQIYKTGAFSGETTTDINGYFEFAITLFDTTSITITTMFEDTDEYSEGYSLYANPGDVISNINIYSKGWYWDESHVTNWPLVNFGTFSHPIDGSSDISWIASHSSMFGGIEMNGILNPDREIEIVSRIQIDHDWWHTSAIPLGAQFISVGIVHSSYRILRRDGSGTYVPLSVLTVPPSNRYSQSNAEEPMVGSAELASLYLKTASILLAIGQATWFTVAMSIITEVGTTLIGGTDNPIIWTDQGFDSGTDEAFADLRLEPRSMSKTGVYPVVDLDEDGEYDRGCLSFLHFIEFNFPPGEDSGDYCIEIDFSISFYRFVWEVFGLYRRVDHIVTEPLSQEKIYFTAE